MLAELRTHAWAYPVLEVVHILGMCLLVGNLFLLEIRLLGLFKALPLPALAQAALPLVGVGAVLAAGSGSLMFATQAAELLGNRAFLAKMGLLLLLGANAAWFHHRRRLLQPDRAARWQAGASAVFWVAVLACGRFIAYV